MLCSVARARQCSSLNSICTNSRIWSDGPFRENCDKAGPEGKGCIVSFTSSLTLLVLPDDTGSQQMQTDPLDVSGNRSWYAARDSLTFSRKSDQSQLYQEIFHGYCELYFYGLGSSSTTRPRILNTLGGRCEEVLHCDSQGD